MSSNKEILEKQTAFIKSFKDIDNEKELRDFEEENQLHIGAQTDAVQDAWDNKWKELTGNPYWQRVPITAKGDDKKKLDPRSNNYLAEETFSAFEWTKNRVRISKRLRPFFTIHGIVKSTGVRRHVWNNLSTYALPQRLGEEAAKKILKDAEGKQNTGVVKGTFKIRCMGFWEVRFHPKRRTSDTEKVKLHWEGQNLQIERGADVILPGFFIEDAHNALEAQYTESDNEPRKLVSWVETYPCDVLRPASYEEWVAYKAEGDRIHREDRKRAGYQV